ncbi:MAG: Re/Si-specific NAD(P)(+) transhydrogenase subunit alpha [Candidatus Omnitrophica bacterium]|nr:Re/Si-specific NAD(P)(+) transhydrogenase subunit alpha [Candidatus Omnitrophota bacterium]
MNIGITKELNNNEKRVAATPSSVEKLTKLGFNVLIEKGLGDSIFASDSLYEKAGAKIMDNSKAILSSCDIILRLDKPSEEEISSLKEQSIYISFLNPFKEKNLIKLLAKKNISAISMELIPRITRAQKMDALSSQASLAGYVAVIIATRESQKVLPMQITPAGTISPARVFIVGAGVAGLQAIATAKRLGARVEAFDTRPEVAEQIQSLGAKFIKIDIGETEKTKDGYAKQLTDEQIKKQRDQMTKICSISDIIVTTAQVFGRTAPLIITDEMISQMKPGSVILDMAVESGGNVSGSEINKIKIINNVKIVGLAKLPSFVAPDASEMYANNLYNLIKEFWNKETKMFDLNLDDQIIKSCLVTYNGSIVNEML